MNKSQYSRRRLGFTLLEIMTSVTLALMLMYAVARIFSRVGGAMNETTSMMETTNALRNVKNRLTLDLESITTSPAPPRNSRLGDGYLCYVEGLGGPLTPEYNGGLPNVFSVADVALDRERFEEYGADDPEDCVDSTVGDLDDILAFTAKAPEGQAFKGRYIEPVYGAVNGRLEIVGGKKSTFESQTAEIVWFVRGTTLYRRVLPIISDKALQDSFLALERINDPYYASLYSNLSDEDLKNVSYVNVKQGYGFYRFYDASVHIGTNGVLVANTLGDLTNRANRYFYWNSCGYGYHPDVDLNGNRIVAPSALNIHGRYGAWYWLRMATLQESAAPNFRAGAAFGQAYYGRDVWRTGDERIATRQIDGVNPAINISQFWQGYNQSLSFNVENGETLLPAGSYACNNLPLPSKPFIDYWNSPNVWVGGSETVDDGVNYETGDLNVTEKDYAANVAADIKPELVFNQDVVLTNVISFNVKAWNPKTNSYVDLGFNVNPDNLNELNRSVYDDPNDLGSYGRYARVNSGPHNDLWLPCVYDTWTEQYQRELCEYNDYQSSQGGTFVGSDSSISNVPAEGEISSSHLKDYPPPYDVKLNSLQVEIRVFDPRSKQIRNATFNVDWSSL